MTNKEIMEGRVSVFRKTRRLAEDEGSGIAVKGLKSFRLKKGGKTSQETNTLNDGDGPKGRLLEDHDD